MKHTLGEKHPTDGLYRLVAGRDLPQHGVRRGDIGGWVRSLSNVRGGAWVEDEARVFGNTKVSGNAKVSQHSMLEGDVEISGNAKVSGGAYVGGEARVGGNAHVFGQAEVFDNVSVFGSARVSGRCEVYGEATVRLSARVRGDVHVCGTADIIFSISSGVWNGDEVLGGGMSGFTFDPPDEDLVQVLREGVKCFLLSHADAQRLHHQQVVFP